MPAQTIGTSLLQGFPGTISRNGSNIVFARQVQSTDANGPAFGAAVVLNANNTYSDLGAFITAGGTFTAVNFGGIAVREAKSFTSFFTQNGTVSYFPGDACDALLFGEAPVVVNVGTPTAGSPVYVRVSANGANTIVGGFEAASDTTHTVLLTNAKFTTGVIDSNNVSELSILSRNI
jgi:hypothetical protein